MFHPTDDVRIEKLRPLIPRTILMENYPLGEEESERIEAARSAAANVIRGSDPRLLAIVGPCSIHDVEAAREYAAKLKALSGELSDALLIVMRVYFEKPRTTVGWKGLINDPRLDGSFAIN